jgi:sensor histidine kinase YesM
MKKIQYIIIHLVFWLIFTIIPQLTFRGYKFIDEEQIRLFIQILPLISVVNFYIVYFGFIPWFLNTKRKYYVLLFLGVFIFLFTLARIEGMEFLAKELDIIENRFVKRFLRGDFAIRELFNTLVFCIYPILIKITENWIIDQKLKADLINQKQSSELALLKFQLSPHFLFNTLNNIYSLVYKKSDNAPAAVMKLSEIMRYMLYDTSTEKVPLDKEIKYLQSFNELQQLRLKNENFVEMSVEGDTSKVSITPMLLIPFVENAFKHGDKKVKSPGIKINIKVEDKTIHFSSLNFIANNVSQQKDVVGGIGLQNVKRRLDLLYADRYSLDISEEDNKYMVELILNLHDD